MIPMCVAHGGGRLHGATPPLTPGAPPPPPSTKRTPKIFALPEFQDPSHTLQRALHAILAMAPIGEAGWLATLAPRGCAWAPEPPALR